MTTDNTVRRVVIVGGGTAGWITASLLARLLGRTLDITLVESEQIGTVGVGEATIPPVVQFNQALGIDEAEFLRETQASIKLGIEFTGWRAPGHSYMHAFGTIGKDFPFASFHHFWARHRLAGGTTDYWDYSLAYQAAKQDRYGHLPRIEEAKLPGLVWAYHFDASLYAAFLRRYSEGKGVTRVEGIVETVQLDPADGFIRSVTLRDGQQLAGDLFVDCSGFRGLLIEQHLQTGYEDWTHWLPCDRAAAVQCEGVEAITPYTRSTAHDAGWQWRIPLQHRIGNGLVYSSRHLSDDDAKARLLANLDGEPLGEPRTLHFRTGRRRLQWHRNCVAMGLSSGFLEPLESTSIHMIQSGAIRLVKLFPHAGIRQHEVDEFNRQSRDEFEHIRDFIILHYHLNGRVGEPFWDACRRMAIPDSLAHRIELFRRTGKVFREQDELFAEIAWQQVLIGQGAEPEDHHPLAGALTDAQLDDLLANLRGIIDRTVARLPDHRAWLERMTSQTGDAAR